MLPSTLSEQPHLPLLLRPSRPQALPHLRLPQQAQRHQLLRPRHHRPHLLEVQALHRPHPHRKLHQQQQQMRDKAPVKFFLVVTSHWLTIKTIPNGRRLTNSPVRSTRSWPTPPSLAWSRRSFRASTSKPSTSPATAITTSLSTASRGPTH